jgi:CheY-like chemotaxis protein
VIGDPVRLGQVLTNLIGNAIKFTPEGKITVTVNLEAKDSQESRIHFQVKDTGIGIAPEKMTAIFETFTQATTDTTRKYGGTGLGLAITKRLLELQGSCIEVESRLGLGSIFSFTLTFKNSNRPVRANREPKPLSLPSLKGTRVLLAEDNPINVLIVQQFLEKWDVDLTIADNGLAALKMVQQQDYDLLLMDLQMPLMDGYQATAAIRHLGGKYQQLPIVALTASAVIDVRDSVLSAGMNDFLTKPFEPNELYKKIARHAAGYPSANQSV